MSVTEMQFLEALRRTQTPTTIYLMNGFQLHGEIIAADETMVWVQDGGTQKAIYKHALSTIVPEREVT